MPARRRRDSFPLFSKGGLKTIFLSDCDPPHRRSQAIFFFFFRRWRATRQNVSLSPDQCRFGRLLYPAVPGRNERHLPASSDSVGQDRSVGVSFIPLPFCTYPAFLSLSPAYMTRFTFFGTCCQIRSRPPPYPLAHPTLPTARFSPRCPTPFPCSILLGAMFPLSLASSTFILGLIISPFLERDGPLLCSLPPSVYWEMDWSLGTFFWQDPDFSSSVLWYGCETRFFFAAGDPLALRCGLPALSPPR